MDKCTSANERFCKMAAVTTQTVQHLIASFVSTRTAENPAISVSRRDVSRKFSGCIVLK
jgi:hypothetical protein